MQLWPVAHFWVGLLLLCCCTNSKVMTQWKKWATGQSCIHKEVSSYKIHTLVTSQYQSIIAMLSLVFCGVLLSPFYDIMWLPHVWLKPITGWINLVFWWSFPLSSFFSWTGCIALALMNKVNGTWSIATKKGPKCGFYISLSWVI